MQRRTLILIIVIILILLCLFLIYWLFGRSPQAVDDVFETAVNTAVSDNVLTNDTPDGQLTVTIPPEALPANGTLDLQSTGEFTYTPNPDFAGSDTFTYEACRSIGFLNRCDTAVVTITVKIDAVDDMVTTPQNQSQTGNVLTNDLPPGQLIAVSAISTTDEGGTFDLQETGDFTYTPATDYVGSDAVSYQACLSTDPTNCDTATVVMTVEPPVVVDAMDDSVATATNTSVSGNVLANDIPSGQLTATAFMTTTQANGTFELLSTGVFTYTPATDYEGDDEVSYQACLTTDSSKCDTAVVSIAVVGEPDAVDDNYETVKNQPVSGNVLDNDMPAGQLTASSTEFDLAADGEFTYTPTTDFVGTVTFNYQACLTSDASKCDTAVVTIQVVDEPDAVDDDYETVKNQPVSGNVLDNDIPTGQLTASSTEFDLVADGKFTYTPATDFVGTVTFNYQACLASDASRCDTAVVTIEVTETPPPGDTPDAVDDEYETEINQPVSGNVLDNDLPAGQLTASSTEFDLTADGSFTYTPDTDFVGTVTFNYQACLASDDSKCDTAVVTITVTNGTGQEPVEHTVQKGEWLLQIARCYGTSPESIVQANHIRYPSWIMPGDIWVIPHVGDVSEPFNDGACIIWYKAAAGDTLESIADEYKVDLDMLVKANYGCYGYHSMYPNTQYGYDMHSPHIYSGCHFPGVPKIHEGQQLVIPVNNENKGLRP